MKQTVLLMSVMALAVVGVADPRVDAYREAGRLLPEAEAVAKDMTRASLRMTAALRAMESPGLAVVVADDPTSAVLDAQLPLARLRWAVSEMSDAVTTYTMRLEELGPLLDALAVEDAGEME